MDGLSATLVYVGIGSVLAVSVAILTVAVLFLQTARRYVDLAEERLEILREGQALLLKAARQQSPASEESLEREPERGEQIPEVVGQPLGQRTAKESPTSFRPPEPLDLRAREAPSTGGQGSSPAEAREQRREKAPKAGASGEAAPRPKDTAPRLGVKVPHLDDEVTPRVWNSSAAKFFQKKYDLYLEQYEGYVRLAERIHLIRNEAEAIPGTPETREWEEKLHRAYEAIERTTRRLDVLEQHYPELATDSNRLSARLGIARLQAGLAERFGSPR
jgi:hypothetical protein